ncbi:MAG: Asp-tRNA(Asn)/Glu-tRNA(Gln) amidotransferase subunit GatC [Brachymonas sp.]|nr:Asp-tRNA(Asn)/Glu-tRNA(Gln) amidotransferase subunit GatC [Brachymonas sp.]
MPLTPENIQALCRLSKLSLSDAESADVLQHLNGFFNTVVTPMQAVDTAGVTPLAHPVEIFREVTLRLREDVASEPNQREANQRSAPQVENGLFIVPKVIE